MHEASLHDANSFLTLTYSDEFLPEGGSLVHAHCQSFFKRLRESGPFRYFMAGEYGDKRMRPHYHVLVFGRDFERDRYEWRRRRGVMYYRSETVEKAWTHRGEAEAIGNCEFSIDVNFKNAAYVARYVTKKLTGELADERYRRKVGDRWFELKPEYCAMSRRPGIGKEWFRRYHPDVFPDDFVVVGGRKIATPRYYYKLLEEQNEGLAVQIKEDRYARARERERESLGKGLVEKYRPLDAREKICEARLGMLRRPLEAEE